jgi:hypothetical protein
MFGCEQTPPVVAGNPAGAGQAAAGDRGSTSAGVKASGASGTSAAGDQIVARAFADIAPFGSGHIMGKYTFVQGADGGVTGTLTLTNCDQAGKTYYAFVRTGQGCGSEADIGDHASLDNWGASAPCSSSGKVTAYAVRIAQRTLPSAWSIGGSSKTDIVGHAVIVTLDSELVQKPTIIGCGVIKKSD